MPAPSAGRARRKPARGVHRGAAAAMGRHTLSRTSRMSIVAAADPEGSALSLVVAGAAGLVSVVVAVMTGVLTPSELGGRRHRIPPGRPMAPLVGVLVAGIIVWM